MLSRAGSGLADPCGVKGTRGSLETVASQLEGATSVLLHDGPLWGDTGSYSLNAPHTPGRLHEHEE